MPFDPALYGRIPPRTARYGNSVYGRIGVASAAVVIPIEAQGFAITPGPDLTLTLTLPRGAGTFGLVEMIGAQAIPLPSSLSRRLFSRLPTHANIKFTEGTTFRVGLNFLDVEHNQVNLAGASLLFNLYQRSAPQQNATPILSKSINSGILVLSASTGKAMVTFTYTDTHDLPGFYDWELQITEASGDVYTPGMGVLIVLPARRILQ